MKQGRPACQIQTKEKANFKIASQIKYETVAILLNNLIGIRKNNHS